MEVSKTRGEEGAKVEKTNITKGFQSLTEK
jgi:hypothetical protein